MEYQHKGREVRSTGSIYSSLPLVTAGVDHEAIPCNGKVSGTVACRVSSGCWGATVEWSVPSLRH